MKKAAFLAIFLFLTPALLLVDFQSAHAVDYYGGKILKRDKLSKALSHVLRGANVVAQLTIENNKLEGGKTIKSRERVFIVGAVLGPCRPDRSILGLGHRIKGHKVITLGICQ